MHEHFYDLLPGEDPSEIDGHLLVVLLDSSQVSDAFAEYCERRIVRLSDRAEFQIAMVDADNFPSMKKNARDFPALFHFSCGKETRRNHGVDDSLDYLKEFIINNLRH